MPRKTKKIESVDSDSPEKEPQSTTTTKRNSDKKEPTNERNTNGQFAKGNSGGPGNPHARACAKMLEVFRNAITEDEMLQICKMLVVKAVGGDVSAAKIVLSYRIGKPLPAPHPDSIDRDEWDHYQQDAMNEKEVALVMNGWPTAVGNDIARVSLPIMTAERKKDLARQLLKDCPIPASQHETEIDESEVEADAPAACPEDESSEGFVASDSERVEKSSPLPNRNLNGKIGGHSTASSAQHRCENSNPQRTRKAPIPNRGKKHGTKGKKKRKSEWLQRLAKQVGASVEA
jgi:hypothetical protein